jgi:hypothetical protein
VNSLVSQLSFPQQVLQCQPAAAAAVIIVLIPAVSVATAFDGSLLCA